MEGAPAGRRTDATTGVGGSGPPVGPTLSASASPSGRGRRRLTRLVDRGFGWVVSAAGVAILALPILFVLVITSASWRSLVEFGPGFVIGRVWDPNLPPITFGAAPFVVGTIETSVVAMLIGVPLSLGAAIFLAELAPDWLRAPVASVVDLLAAVPSVVFGLWGLYVLVPYLRANVYPGLSRWLGWTLLFHGSASSQSGLSVLSASIILAIMILPTISSVSREALRAAPDSQREAALSLGATRWEATRIGPLAFARSGIFGAAILGFGRAMGETMAVTMTIGNANIVPTSLLDPGQTLSSQIALSFGNALPLERSALVELGLLLMAVSLLVNVVARLLLRRMTRIGGVTI